MVLELESENQLSACKCQLKPREASGARERREERRGGGRNPRDSTGSRSRRRRDPNLRLRESSAWEPGKRESKRGGASKGAVLPRGQVSIGKGPSDLSVGRGLGTIAGVVRSQLDCGVKER